MINALTTQLTIPTPTSLLVENSLFGETREKQYHFTYYTVYIMLLISPIRSPTNELPVTGSRGGSSLIWPI